MERFFSQDNKFFRFLGRVGDLILLNILWIVGCLPVVTIGVSTSALYYAVSKIVLDKDTYTVRMFLHSFRQNLKQGILLTLLYLISGALLLADVFFCIASGTFLSSILLGFFLILAVIWLTALSYTFPFLSQFDNSILNILKKSLFMGMHHLPCTAVILLLNSLPVIIVLIQPYFFLLSIPLWGLLGFSGTAWINAHLFIRIFAKYMPPKESEEERADQ